jgi:hypothetical protein
VRTALATLVAVLLAVTPAWGHTFPKLRTVVLQIERCEAVLLVGYRPASGEDTKRVLSQASGDPKANALRDVLAAEALATLSLSVDGKPLLASSVRAKIGVEPGGQRPMVVLLVTYALPPGGKLTLTSRDPKATRISWQDRDSGRLDPADNPAQDQWFDGVASFLLELRSNPSCASSSSSP